MNWFKGHMWLLDALTTSITLIMNMKVELLQLYNGLEISNL